MTLKDLYSLLDQWAPFATQEEFDNCGLLVGDPAQPIKKIGIALDITNPIVEKAAQSGVDVIVSHHPVIFHGLKQVTAENPVYRLIRANIGAIACHTNLDKAEGGVNTTLASYYGLENISSPLCMEDLGRVGELRQPMSVEEYAKQIKQAVGAQGIRFYDAGIPVKRVAYVSGSGGSMLRQAMSCEIDTFITGDIKHDQFIEAENCGLNLIEVGHFDSENTVMEPLKTYLEKNTGLPVQVLSLQNPVQTR
ncbi:MAG: Nif3-like dinuclear metal center hexameric protein [Massiliimalia sp.]|jgi:dinuclear metal center YbgI/SA1388 family protein